MTNLLVAVVLEGLAAFEALAWLMPLIMCRWFKKKSWKHD